MYFDEHVHESFTLIIHYSVIDINEIKKRKLKILQFYTKSDVQRVKEKKNSGKHNFHSSVFFFFFLLFYNIFFSFEIFSFGMISNFPHALPIGVKFQLMMIYSM